MRLPIGGIARGVTWAGRMAGITAGSFPQREKRGTRIMSKVDLGKGDAMRRLDPTKLKYPTRKCRCCFRRRRGIVVGPAIPWCSPPGRFYCWDALRCCLISAAAGRVIRQWETKRSAVTEGVSTAMTALELPIRTRGNRRSAGESRSTASTPTSGRRGYKRWRGYHNER